MRFVPFAFVRRREPDLTNYQVPVTSEREIPVARDGRIPGIPEPVRSGDFDGWEGLGGAHPGAKLSIAFATGGPPWENESFGHGDKVYLTDESWVGMPPSRYTTPPDRIVIARPPARGQSSTGR
jgi:hypothetical protein